MKKPQPKPPYSYKTMTAQAESLITFFMNNCPSGATHREDWAFGIYLFWAGLPRTRKSDEIRLLALMGLDENGNKKGATIYDLPTWKRSQPPK